MRGIDKTLSRGSTANSRTQKSLHEFWSDDSTIVYNIIPLEIPIGNPYAQTRSECHSPTRPFRTITYLNCTLFVTVGTCGSKPI